MPSTPFMKIDRDEPLSHKVELQIREAIRKKIFIPGDKLPGELELAERFGVSRTAIREALRILAGRGLVDIQKGSGVYVTEIDMSNVVDPFYQLLDMKCGETSLLHLIRIRIFLEPQIARLASEHCKEDDILFLEKNLQLMKEHTNKPEEMIEIDIKFHRRLASATNNPIIPVIMEPIFQLLHKFIASTYKQAHAPELAIKNHTILLNYLKIKDFQKTYDTMYEHMQQAEEHAIKYLESIDMSKSETMS